ncbi:EamA family transporter [Candidatus Bathyarchaeota archaeon]|nr:EamA family transporter [Candidatus Bathyarchaeota archaeon]
MNDQWRGSILVLVSAISFGFLPIFARFAYSSGIKVQELLMIRFLLASVIVGVFLYAARRASIPSRNQFLVLIALGGFGYFLQSYLYFTSLLYIPVSVVALVLYTYPAFVMAGSLALGWEKVSIPVAISLFTALTGLALVANPIFNLAAIGLLMVLGAAITYTGYILVSSRILRELSGEVASFYVMISASLSFGIASLLAGRLYIAWNLAGWFWVIMISVISTALAATTFFQGLRLIGPSRASILSLTEPIASIIASFILFKETLTPIQWIGGLLILSAAITVTLSKPSQRKEKHQRNVKA